MWWIDAQHSWQLGLLGSGALLMLLHLLVPQLRKGTGAKVLLSLMVVVALGSSLAYTRFLDFQGPRRGMLHTYHDHDIYHYLIGSKYYPELGHQRLYECTWLAFAEMRTSGIKTPKVPKLRSLRDPNKFFNPNERREAIHNRCHAAFGDMRWREFKADLGAWLVTPWNDQQWRVALADLGFNPPPTYNIFAHNIAESKRIQNATLQLFPFVDMTLVFVVGGAFVWWAFGPWALCAYLVIFGTNWVASYRWTGGSFCRQLWFVYLVCGISLLKKERWALAGGMLALCASMRVFPLVFVLGAVLALAGAAWRDPERRSDFGWLVGGGLGTAAALVAVSLWQFGPDLWREFFQKMGHHGTSWFMWHIGFKKFVVFYPEVAENSGVRLARGFWWAPPPKFEEIYAASRWWAEPTRIGMSLAAVAIAWRRKATEATLIVGGTLLFFWSMPANYYYVYLAIAPAVFYDPEGDRWSTARVAMVFLAMFSMACSRFVHAEPFVMNGHLNRTMFWFFVVLLGSYGLELGLPWWRARQAAVAKT